MDDLIIRFCLTGELNGITLGKTVEEIEDFLGEPDYLDKDGDSTNLMKYSSLDLAFDDNKVSLINLVYLDGAFILPEKLIAGSSASKIKGKITLEELTELLAENDVEWRIYTEFTEHETVCLITQSNAMIFFGLLYSGLDKIQLVDSDEHKYEEDDVVEI